MPHHGNVVTDGHLVGRELGMTKNDRKMLSDLTQVSRREKYTSATPEDIIELPKGLIINLTKQRH